MEKTKVVAIMKLEDSGSTLRIWDLHFAERNVRAPTVAVWSAALSPGEYLTLRLMAKLSVLFRILYSKCFKTSVSKDFDMHCYCTAFPI